MNGSIYHGTTLNRKKYNGIDYNVMVAEITNELKFFNEFRLRSMFEICSFKTNKRFLGVFE